MTRGYFRLVPGLRDSASMIGAKSVPALASTYSTPRSARRVRKDSAVMREAVSVTGWSLGWKMREFEERIDPITPPPCPVMAPSYPGRSGRIDAAQHQDQRIGMGRDRRTI